MAHVLAAVQQHTILPVGIEAGGSHHELSHPPGEVPDFSRRDVCVSAWLVVTDRNTPLTARVVACFRHGMAERLFVSFGMDFTDHDVP